MEPLLAELAKGGVQWVLVALMFWYLVNDKKALLEQQKEDKKTIMDVLKNDIKVIEGATTAQIAMVKAFDELRHAIRDKP